MTGYTDSHEALDALIGGEGPRAVLAAGAPRCGKTGFAYEALLRGLHAFGGEGAAMAVSNRVIADLLGDRAIRRIGASAQVRPVTTLSALAFRVISARRFATGSPAPRLLNGAEQDALLRRVLAVHLVHARAGEMCDVCRLLRSYFASDDWARSVGDMPAADDGDGVGAGPGEGTTAAMLERGVSQALVDQLRDMLARMNELGASFGREEGLIATLRARAAASGEGSGHAARLELQWRLAFALRHEYVDAIEAAHPGEYRLDASRLLVEGAAALQDGDAAGLPGLLVVDDFQDTTLAGLRFLEALSARGVRLLLVGNPDEAVQTFRGSYPEYLFSQARLGPLGAVEVRLGAGPAAAAPAAPSYLDLVAARVSLSIPSMEESGIPLPERPGKLPRYDGAWPIRTPDPAHDPTGDGTLRTALYRSPREELDDVVWRIKRMRLDGHAQWNDMAVIAHDNATVRTFGERLRHDGVPVRYSSVTKPLKDEPFVQGLFALLELARLRRQGLSGTTMSPAAIAAFARSRVATVMACPLITTGARPGEGRPGRLAPIESAMAALESLSQVVDDGLAGDADDAGGSGETSEAAGRAVRGDGGGDRGALAGVVAGWRSLTEQWRAQRDAADASGNVVDDSLTDGEETPPFGVDALYAMLVLDDPLAPAADVLSVIGRVVGGDPQAKAFLRLWRLVGVIASGLGSLEDAEPQFALAMAWQACGVAGAWQREALDNTPEGRAANDRLDVAMRLFQYAEGGTAGHDITAFIAQVRSMRIEADSLAHVGPVEQAVTLTTPAGAVGRHWRHVWMPAVQQDVWPNLAERNTLFGGEDLAEIMLDATRAGGDADRAAAGAAGRGGGTDPRLAAVLASEKKSFLFALTRADAGSVGGWADEAGNRAGDGHGARNDGRDGATVSVSAVANDDLTPSDFLYGYLPERFDRAEARFTEVGDPEQAEDPSRSSGDPLAGLDADPRGLVAAARIILSRHPADSPQGRDAAAALALLAGHGVSSADPADWSYPRLIVRGKSDAAPDSESAPVVSLSPSAVDRLWECPVCWLLENRFSGPRPGSVATGFGTLIHAVAQRGSEEGLDLPVAAPGGVEARVDEVAGRLAAIYDGLKAGQASIDDPAARYAAMRKDEQVGTALGNIAGYFVRSNHAGYLGGNAKYLHIGTLERADCEEEFAARFDLGDILAAYNALPGIEPIGRHDLAALMGALVGGWPEGMRDDLTIRLTGRIDRKETRVDGNGDRTIRLIDYKTGRVPAVGQIFNDLQLVCYQLGLVFPETSGRPGEAKGGGMRGARALEAAPVIAQSGLFHVESHAAPAESYSPEGLFQPPLFTAGSLNGEAFTQRDHYRDLSRLADMPVLSPDAPVAGGGDGPGAGDARAETTGVSRPRGVDDDVWARFASLNGTQALWSLTMISRVFYAAAASRSERLAAHPTAAHLAHCRMRDVCPACAGRVDTVFETRQA
ncbi:PD-(D/E)XK nuclease family protein [Bifidobacterium platyrrhinorum]|uniref:Nuclease n=1 Tax=Bifidobacterium platyrrhinorum TaxID=2661628 RepID=A0A6L9STA9_9BIFI|nr:PD-(D/E)XK nuclease family protein [Bifidobacterium platyrrhinorum]NEG55846.1 nuclease [Bifidobacterium platyrrhinorum]